MLTFTPVTQRDIARLRRYYKSCEYQLCEYSALVKLMWRSHLHPSWAEGAGCLIVRNFIDGQYCFDYPVPGPDGDEDAALTLIEDDCRERDIPLVLSVVPQDKAERLAARYPYFRFSSPRVWRDYIYAATSPDAATPASATTSTSSASSIPTPPSARSGRATCRSSRSSSATTRPSSPRRPTRRKTSCAAPRKCSA